MTAATILIAVALACSVGPTFAGEDHAGLPSVIYLGNFSKMTFTEGAIVKCCVWS